jgi:hypothetical protein
MESEGRGGSEGKTIREEFTTREMGSILPSKKSQRGKKKDDEQFLTFGISDIIHNETLGGAEDVLVSKENTKTVTNNCN